MLYYILIAAIVGVAFPSAVGFAGAMASVVCGLGPRFSVAMGLVVMLVTEALNITIVTCNCGNLTLNLTIAMAVNVLMIVTLVAITTFFLRTPGNPCGRQNRDNATELRALV